MIGGFDPLVEVKRWGKVCSEEHILDLCFDSASCHVCSLHDSHDFLLRFSSSDAQGFSPKASI